LLALLADDAQGQLAAPVARLPPDGAYPALTPDCPAAHGWERLLAEESGLRPEGHPGRKPVRFPPANGVACGDQDYYRVEGAAVHEVAVGPVHAGIIEPGHFRFQCVGERVLHLEISLGYQHRGIERRLRGGPDRRTAPLIETAAGDTTVGHALAHAALREALADAPPTPRGALLRALALELERLANHTGDLGALAHDVAFLPTANYNGRIRGEFLNMTALLCGNRFGRGLVRPGGVTRDLEPDRAAELARRLAAARRDVTVAVELMRAAPSVASRFEETGALDTEAAAALGLVGPAARACGIRRDLRADFPDAAFRARPIAPAVETGGDARARADVRWAEMQRSLDWLDAALTALPDGPLAIAAAESAPLPPDRLAVGLCEGWRGAITHVAVTDAAGRFARYRICDPSFYNWPGLAYAMRDQEISDFPLCNKSFNLSYCGHDL